MAFIQKAASIFLHERVRLEFGAQWAFKFIYYHMWQESETVSELQLYCLFCETLINKVFTCYLTANPRLYHCMFIKKRVYHCLLRLLFKGGFYCFFNEFVRFLFEGGFYSRAVSIQENTVYKVLYQKGKSAIHLFEFTV